MENTYFIGSCNINELTLEYYVIGNSLLNELSGYFEWGIKIVKSKKNEIIEEETIRNITQDYNKALKIAKLLERNTPLVMKDALYNITESPVI